VLRYGAGSHISKEKKEGNTKLYPKYNYDVTFLIMYVILSYKW